MTHVPSFRSLLLCWAVLMSMTIVLLIAADPSAPGGLSLLIIALLLGVALIKARQILWVFLGLRRSTTMWKATFLAFLGTILAIVMGFAGLAAAMGR
ncbi:MAG TPA: cytochrome C oxidase subunit IV family protein [Candidatus Sulfotelmatobacter sp.]|jgi:hypothetical protein|nr:cytochrome C oxidase subunit IV family protein [Candidatus Sulfotelmatobacter sp.]